MKFVESVRELILQALDEGILSHYVIVSSVVVAGSIMFFIAPRSPWFVLPALLPVIAFCLYPFWNHLRSKRVRSWTATDATLGHSTIRYEGERGARPHLQISYVYVVSGERYGGLYSAGFSNDEEVNTFLEGLKQGPFEIRYDPNDPRFSCFFRQ